MSVIQAGSPLLSESGKHYLPVSALGQANVWTAVEQDTSGSPVGVVVLKCPATDDNGASWPLFQHEMIMHELFKDCTAIRKQVDRISPGEKAPGSPPILVLEIFETTLWQARAKRPFSQGEIDVVARSILKGLEEVHAKGLVFVDIKMQNVMLNGFDVSKPGDGSKLSVKLGDLGIVMSPMNGTSQPIVYRAPEVYFKGEIDQAADIWAFGLVYCHLLEARMRFSKTGLYDDLETGHDTMPEREQAVRHAMANDYDIENMRYYKGCITPYRDHDCDTGNHWDELRHRGLTEAQVDFLQWVLHADPTKRPTATEILNSKWLHSHSATAPMTQSRPGTARGLSTLAIGEHHHGHVHHDHSHEAPTPPARDEAKQFEAEDATVKRRRTDESKHPVPSSPGKIALPPPRPLEQLMRGQSRSVFTPTGGAHGFEKLASREGETEGRPASPIKAHPLVASVVEMGERERRSLDEPARNGPTETHPRDQNGRHSGPSPTRNGQPTFAQTPSAPVQFIAGADASLRSSTTGGNVPIQTSGGDDWRAAVSHASKSSGYQFERPAYVEAAHTSTSSAQPSPQQAMSGVPEDTTTQPSGDDWRAAVKGAAAPVVARPAYKTSATGERYMSFGD